MGLLRALRLAESAAASAPLAASPVQGYPATLPPDVAAAFGVPQAGSDTVTREEAMSIPALRRGRSIICATLGTLPLIAVRPGTTEHVPRELLAQPDPDTTLQWQLTYTLDDLLFYGLSWWLVTGRDTQGYPRRAVRLAPHRVMVDIDRGTVTLDGRPVPDGDLLRFDGPDEGVLAHGGRTLRTCLQLDAAVRQFARLDVPLGVLEQADGSPSLTREEVEDLLDAWESSRRTHTTAFLNPAVRYQPIAFDAQRIQLAEARAYQNAEVARLLNLPGRYVGASDGDSMTYANTESARRDLVDTSLAPYIAAVEQRLSMGDVTPRGQTVRLDLTGFLRGDTATALGWATQAVALGAMTAAEVRTDLLNRPALEGTSDG